MQNIPVIVIPNIDESWSKGFGIGIKNERMLHILA